MTDGYPNGRSILRLKFSYAVMFHRRAADETSNRAICGGGRLHLRACDEGAGGEIGNTLVIWPAKSSFACSRRPVLFPNPTFGS